MLKTFLQSLVTVLALSAYADTSAQTSTDRPQIPGTVHTVLEANGRLKFVFVPDISVQVLKPSEKFSQSAQTPLVRGILDPSKLTGNKANTFMVTSDKGKFAGYWIGAE